MQILRIPPEDIGTIKSLWEALNEHHRDRSTHFKSHFERFTFEQRLDLLRHKDAFTVFVAMEDAVPVGYCIVSVNGETGEIDSIYVSPHHQRQGVGHALMTKAETFLDARGVRRVIVSVAEGNETAFGFYETRGFRHRMTVFEKAAT